MKTHYFRNFVSLLAVIGLAFVLAGCDERTVTTSEQQEATRDSAMDRAHNAVPIPRTQNFLTRETVAEFMRRTDEPNKTFYIYLLNSMGNYIGFYVARGRPVNICTFLSPPDRVTREYVGNGASRSYGNFKRAAPGMDGVYYGSGACDSEYFFDASSDALIEIITRGGISMFVTDRPLELDVQQIQIRVESAEDSGDSG